MKLIVGLGNPGERYENTRHNVGFAIINNLISKFEIRNSKQDFKTSTKFNSELIFVEDLLLAKPQTFMNLSGQAVSAIANYYKILPEDICVVHDDLDIQMGNYKFEFAHGPKIHNGINSVQTSLGTKDFWRVRIGVDNRTPDQKSQIKGSDYVLMKLSKAENQILNETFDQITQEIESEFI